MLALSGTAGAASCDYQGAALTVAASLGEESATFSVGPFGEIRMNGLPCDGATVTNTDSVVITGTEGTGETVEIDLSGGRFEPGVTAEPGISEIEFTITLTGDRGDRLIVVGTPEADSIRLGRAGIGLNGDDDFDIDRPGSESIEVMGRAGADVLLGSGDDVGSPATIPLQLRGEGGDDRLTGGAGNDLLSGGEGDEVLDGYEGDDELVGDHGKDTALFPASGGVRVDLSTGSSTGLGQDFLSGIEDVTGSPGPDRLFGDDGQNLLTGGNGNDRISGYGGNDLLDGGRGKDFMKPGLGDDRVLGAEGSDTCSLRSSPRPVRINLSSLTSVGEGADLITGVESAVGSRFRDLIRGTGARNRRLIGSRGNDRIYGLGGPDRLRGGPGNDLMIGGPDDDDLEGSGGDDILRGDDGDDSMSGGSGEDTCVDDGPRPPQADCEVTRSA